MFSKYGFIRSKWRKFRRPSRDTKQKRRYDKMVDRIVNAHNLPGSERKLNTDIFDYYSWEELGGRANVEAKTDSRPCYIWFVPDWLNVWGGGHYTLFRFANHFAKKGTRQIIFVYNNQRHESPDALLATLNSALENCQLEVIVDPSKLPRCDAAIATTWQSAYFVRSFPHAASKFYFMQDFESQFYAHGTQSMQALNSYSFGFHGITGGGWNKMHFESFGGKAEAYIFATDRNLFFPVDQSGRTREAVKKIFFYGRPSTERRCFELGVASLALIATKYPDIEIVMAGLDIGSTMPFKVTMLGNLTLAKTGELYRTCDIGIAFSGTNLSYLPVELMACGVPVVSNRGDQVEWYCEHGVNALLVDPTPMSVLSAVDELVGNHDLRTLLASNGLKISRERTWESEMDRIYDYSVSCLAADQKR